MIDSILSFGFLTILYSQTSGIPEWYYPDDSSQVAVCLNAKSSASQLRTIAIAKAQAELLRQREVSIRSELIITREKNSKTGGSLSTMNEKITQKSEGVIEKNRVIKSGIFFFDDARQYCILYGKEKLVG